jgi:hypothetical protein
MTRFVIVNPRARKIEAVECESVMDAQDIAGLGNVDHGVIAQGLGFVVDEFGLFVPPAQQAYFGLFGKLIAGTAVFYAFDEMGETLSLRASEFPDVRWYLGVNDVEASIAREEIERPIIAVNGMVLWEWPQPAPAGFTR